MQGRKQDLEGLSRSPQKRVSGPTRSRAGRPSKVSNALKKEITTSWQRKEEYPGRVMIDLVSVLLFHSQQESINKTSLPYGSSWHVKIS